MKSNTAYSVCESLASRTFLYAGELDRSFDRDGIAQALLGTRGLEAFDIAVLPDDSVLVAGGVLRAVGETSQPFVAKFKPDGSVDQRFGSNGITRLDSSDEQIGEIKIGKSGEIYLGAAGHLFKLTSTGKLDTRFASRGVLGAAAYNFDLAPDGKIVTATARFDSLGRLDRTFRRANIEAVTHFDTIDVYDVTVQPDGKVLLSAAVGADNEFLYIFTTDAALLRLNADGSLDTGFNIRQWELRENGSASESIVRPDGRIAVIVNAEDGDSAIAQLLSDGTDDPAVPQTEIRNGPAALALYNPSAYRHYTDIALDRKNRLVVTGRAFNPESGIDILDPVTGEVSSVSAGALSYRLDANLRTDPEYLVSPYSPHSPSDVSNYELLAIDSKDRPITCADGVTTDGIYPGTGLLLSRKLAETLPGTIQNGNQLVLFGTSNDDAFTLRVEGTNAVVTFNGKVTRINASQITSVNVLDRGGNDTVRASASWRAPITFQNDPGNDTFQGGSGNDTFMSGVGSDVMIGAAGNDTADYSFASGNLRITLDNLPDDGTAGERDNVGGDIESVFGGFGNDLIVGNPARNSFNGGYGNDTLWGGDGNDTLDGGRGRDQLFGQGGRDLLLAYDYSNEVKTRDLLHGGGGVDRYRADKRDALISLEERDSLPA